jgi:hypothetical protein
MRRPIGFVLEGHIYADFMLIYAEKLEINPPL